MTDIQYCNKDFLNHLQTALSGRERKVLDQPHYGRAAVLVPLFMKEGICHLLLTKRTHQVKNHKGEISFPGGMVDEGDSGLEETALREAFEEVGLKREDVQVIGALDDIMTYTGFIVTPFVGFFPYPYPFKVSHFEIEEMIEVPLSLLMGEAARGEVPENPSYQYGAHTIWGATARILSKFLDLIASS
jgi:8-oxo-dGTP pyrophosphatase MutT (NUDIX family)